MCRTRRSVEQDYGKSIEWYLKASDVEQAYALRVIGDM